ncbi:MAG: nuclear transport factor 2 family protein [Ilumatobacteraceae bacterium]
MAARTTELTSTDRIRRSNVQLMSSVDAIITELFQALDSKDVDRICAVLADDSAMVDEITKGWMFGSETVRAHLESTLSNVDSISSTVRDLRVRDRGQFATATCTLDQTYRFGGEQVDVVAPTSFSLELTSGEWKIVQMHSVPLGDA